MLRDLKVSQYLFILAPDTNPVNPVVGVVRQNFRLSDPGMDHSSYNP